MSDESMTVPPAFAPLTFIVRLTLTIVGILFFALNSISFAEEGDTSPPASPDVKIEKNYDDRYELIKTFNQKVFEFVDSVNIDDDIKDLELSVFKVAVYRMPQKRESDIPVEMAELLEGKLKNKLIKTKRLQVFECIECRVVHINLRKEKLVMSRTLESNEGLRDLGKQIGVDGFLLWNITYDEMNIYLDLNIVNVSNGMVVWSRQYSKNPILKKYKPEYKLTISMSVLGYETIRKKTNGGQTKVSNIFSENIIFTKKSSISEDISVGLGMSYFHNLSEFSSIRISGLSVYPYLEIRFGPLMKRSKEDMNMLSYYLGVGITLYDKYESALLLSGVNINVTDDIFFGVGISNLTRKSVSMKDRAGFDKTTEFGGLTYDVKFGYRF